MAQIWRRRFFKNLPESRRKSKSVAGDLKNLPEVRRRSKSAAGNILISRRLFHSGIFMGELKFVDIINKVIFQDLINDTIISNYLTKDKISWNYLKDNPLWKRRRDMRISPATDFDLLGTSGRFLKSPATDLTSYRPPGDF